MSDSFFEGNKNSRKFSIGLEGDRKIKRERKKAHSLRNCLLSKGKTAIPTGRMEYNFFLTLPSSRPGFDFLLVLGFPVYDRLLRTFDCGLADLGSEITQDQGLRGGGALF